MAFLKRFMWTIKPNIGFVCGENLGRTVARTNTFNVSCYHYTGLGFHTFDTLHKSILYRNDISHVWWNQRQGIKCRVPFRKMKL